MALGLPRQDASIFQRRRAALAEHLDGRPALIFAGGPKAMNYPGNPYPYRADSHFLYLTGASLPHAALLLRGDKAELFMTKPPEDDALWHGPTPAWPQISAHLGVDAIRDDAELGAQVATLGSAEIGTLPSADPVTRARQQHLLARDWSTPTPDLSGSDALVADAMIKLRLVHDAGAVECLRGAAEATAAAHVAGMRATRPGMREYQIKAAMEAAMADRGCRTSYQPIVTVHGEVLHNNHYGHEIAAGDLLLADVGAEYEGWAGDVTRTWPVGGQFSPTQKAMYQIVLQAQLDAIDEVRPGVRYREVHLAAARTLTRGLVDEGLLRGDVDNLVERGAHALFFPHGVGHIIGLDVHDMEDLGDRAGYASGRQRADQFGLGYLRLDRDLAPGMCVTVEPGIYFVPAILEHPELSGPFDADGSLNREAVARFADVRGIRIEDDVLCTSDAPEVLTAAAPKAVDAVESLVGSG